MTEERYAPIYDKTADFVASLPITQEARLAVIESKASVVDEFDVFPRSGNRTDWNRDAMAFTSAKMERLIDGRDGYAFTYSTMKDRRVDDIIFEALYHMSGFVYKPTPRDDKGKDGKPKMQSHDAERRRWIQSLGFEQKAVAEIPHEAGKGKGKRNLFGDTFAPLKEELEALIPERFDGTKIPPTAKQLLALVAPAKLGAEIIRINVYKPGNPGNTNSLLTLVKFLLDGYRFQTDKEGRVVGELAQFYSDLADAKITEIKQAEQAALEAQLKQDAEKEAAA